MEVPAVPRPSDFPDVELKYEDTVLISEVNGKRLMYAKCRIDRPNFSDASAAECDIIGVVNKGGTLKEEVVGKGYYWDEGRKFVIVMPKQLYYYSGFSGGRPYDNPNPALAKFFIVEKR